jgi:hypothetical protein
MQPYLPILPTIFLGTALPSGSNEQVRQLECLIGRDISEGYDSISKKRSMANGGLHRAHVRLSTHSTESFKLATKTDKGRTKVWPSSITSSATHHIHQLFLRGIEQLNAHSNKHCFVARVFVALPQTPPLHIITIIERMMLSRGILAVVLAAVGTSAFSPSARSSASVRK